MADDTKIQQYVLLAKGVAGRAFPELVKKATSEAGLFAFSELLALPQIQQMATGDYAQHFQLLQLFAYGTWPDYTAALQGSLPELTPAQINKLKQLTVMSLALQSKVIPYSTLQQQLQIGSVRELEDYLITDCFYAGIVKGKLDQKQACLQVHDVLGRDVRLEQLALIEQGFDTWLAASEQLLTNIESRVNENLAAAQAAQAWRDTAAAQIEEVKKTIKTELDQRSGDMMLDETSGMGLLGLVEDGPSSGGMLDTWGKMAAERREPDRHGKMPGRSKKRIQR